MNVPTTVNNKTIFRIDTSSMNSNSRAQM
jgi:hypothetical protein